MRSGVIGGRSRVERRLSVGSGFALSFVLALALSGCASSGGSSSDASSDGTDSAASSSSSASSAAPAAKTPPASVPSGSPLAAIEAGMSQEQVTDLLGQPTRMNNYPTGKNWIPWYYGGDTHRFDWVYAGKGTVVLANKGRFSTALEVVEVIPDPSVE